MKGEKLTKVADILKRNRSFFYKPLKVRLFPFVLPISK